MIIYELPSAHAFQPKIGIEPVGDEGLPQLTLILEDTRLAKTVSITVELDDDAISWLKNMLESI